MEKEEIFHLWLRQNVSGNGDIMTALSDVNAIIFHLYTLRKQKKENVCKHHSHFDEWIDAWWE